MLYKRIKFMSFKEWQNEEIKEDSFIDELLESLK